MIQPRYFLYYLLARIVLILLTVFVFPEIWFRKFLQSYRWYLIIVSISYFTYCYYLEEEEKKFQYLKNSLLIFNIYLTLHIFFRPIINVEPALFVLLGCIILSLLYLSQTHIKYKTPFYIIGGIFSFLILISGIFYLYPEEPNINGFIHQQNTQLILSSHNSLPKYSSYIKLTNLMTHQQQDITFQTWKQNITLPEQYHISYISTSPDNTAETFILFSNGDLLQIFPQSIMHFQTQITPESWTFTRFQAPRTGDKDLNNKMEESSNLLPSQMPRETYQTITLPYRINLQSYLTEQILSPLYQNPTIQQINKTILHFLSKIFPGFFSQNLKNYEQFAYYFSLFNQSQPLFTTEKYFISETLNTNETNLFQQLKNNIQLSLPSLKTFSQEKNN